VLGTSIKTDYNINWLKTEYNMAVRSARMAEKWKGFERVKHLYPNIEFMESTATNKRPEHLQWVGTILPMEHPWWNTHTPPVGWGCECSIENTDKEITTAPGYEEPVMPVFANNPGKTAEFINLEEHPMVKGVCKNFGSCQVRKGMQLSDIPNRPECRICMIVQEMYRNVEARKQRYKSYEKAWEKEYFNSDNGGFVVINKQRITESKKSKNEGIKFDKEKSMCLNYAKSGNTIEMLRSPERESIPDVNFNGILADLKKTSSHNNIVKYAKHAIFDQGAKIVLFEFEKETSKIYDEILKLKRMHIKAYYYFTGNESKIYKTF